jgi:alpha-L-rhamnosidase
MKLLKPCLTVGFATALVAGSMAALSAPAEPAPAFLSAQPVWPEGREKECNLTTGFRAVFEAPAGERVVLRLAGSTLYRAFLNGDFVGHGPARGPHGWYRMDELDLTSKLKAGANVVAIEVAGYNVNSYYLLDQPSFLQAEVVAGGKVLASTGAREHSFEARRIGERVQKVQRYSFQRPFSEVYRLAPGWDGWRREVSAWPEPVVCAVQPAKALLPRRVPYSEFAVRQPVQVVWAGEMKTGLKVNQPWKDRSLTEIGPKLGGFPEKELVTIPSLELQTMANAAARPVGERFREGRTLTLQPGTYQIVDYGINLTGFPAAHVVCRNKARLFFVFDEVLSGGEVDFKRLGCVNTILFELQPGTYDVEAFEAYTLRYLKLIALQGECEISKLSLREFASPLPAEARFAASDERLNKLFAAGCETFRQNAVDIFMDCPSRERAGWLCDSFFTARVAKDLTGGTLIEKNFLENYQLPAKFKFLPEGMLPMCYPADHDDGVFIPNWAMWFVVELEEYLARSGDRETVKALEPRLLKLLDYFKRFRNEDGLLEKLEKWVFVEWSKANDFVQDVNYPSNMLYAEVLAAMGRLYDRPDLLIEAGKIRDIIRRQSFAGDFFVDNAVRRNGKLQGTQNRSEVCQYFAFFFHIATAESHSKLWETLVKDFGPQRKQTKAFPQVHPANAFIGNVLRLELLSQAGLSRQLLDESVAYQLYMADRTGTLWENDGAYASCDHGFASHGGVRVLYRDVLGLAAVDTVNKSVRIRFADLDLGRCEGSLPTPEGKVELGWRKEGGKLLYRLGLPPGYRAEVDNRSKLELVKEP